MPAFKELNLASRSLNAERVFCSCILSSFGAGGDTLASCARAPPLPPITEDSSEIPYPAERMMITSAIDKRARQ